MAMKFQILDSREILLEAKKHLPYGYYKGIADEFKMSPVAISQIANGKTFNEKVFRRIVDDAHKFRSLMAESRKKVFME